MDNLEKLNGMFSFIYDASTHLEMIYFLKKTLFYYRANDKIIISSELNNLKNLSTKSNNRELIYSYLTFGHLIGDNIFIKTSLN